MSSRAHAALLALLLVVTAGPAAGAVTPAAAAPPDRAATAQTAPTPSETTFVIELQPDGDARWTVRLNFSTETERRQAAFRSVVTEFQSGAELRTLSAVRRASAEASDATGRPMSIEGVERSTRTYNETGQLRLSFTWTNFSSESGGTLQAGDAVNTTDGTWLRSLDRDQALVIVPPDGYRLTDARPAGYEVSGGSLRWVGPRSFDGGDVSVRYNRVVSPQFPVDPVLLGTGVVLVVVLVAGAYLLRRRWTDAPTPTGGADPSTGTDGTTAADSGSGSGPDATATDGATPDTATADGDVDEELLSDEERIERLLERNGGRMKQANIVTETGWSNAKVSQLLSSMDEADRIDKLRIGRENLISFPDEDVASTDGEDR